jgi:ABC-type Fe3+ transport system substrate-binding protein
VDFAVLEKSQHPNAAKLFLAWLGSKGYKLMDDINWGVAFPMGALF